MAKYRPDLNRLSETEAAEIEARVRSLGLLEATQAYVLACYDLAVVRGRLELVRPVLGFAESLADDEFGESEDSFWILSDTVEVIRAVIEDMTGGR